MKRLSVLILCVFVLAAISCNGIEPESDMESGGVALTRAQKNILKAENTFGVELFKSVCDKNNIVISPFSISAAFSMLANGAAGKTYDNISGTLGLKGSVQELNGYYRELTGQLTGIDPSVTLSVANSFWMNENLTFKVQFLNALESGYESFNKSVDFSAPETKQKIDDWIKRSTNGMIDHLDADLSPQTGFVLSNAVFFKAIWSECPSGEVMMPFFGNDDSVCMIPFVTWDNASCFVGREVSVCSIPYASGAYSLLAIMPAPGKFDKFIRNLDPDTFDGYARKVSVGDANSRYYLRFPQFEISTVLKDGNLDSKLVKLGMKDVLSGDIDYSNMLEVPVELTTVQQAKIIVNRTGTEASAVTTIASKLSASGLTSSSIVEVNFDRPFIFAIRENSSGAMIFIGAKVL